MTNANAIATWDVLRSLGFEPDPGVMSDEKPGLSYDFGNFKLAASHVLNRSFVPVVLFSGVLRTSRSLAEVRFEMARQVESREQCAAMIAWNLDRAAGGAFEPAPDVPWLNEGRQNQDTLPWRRDLAAYQARPSCTVGRDWLRLALKTLTEMIAAAPDEAPVVFGFDGAVLTMKCTGQMVALAGEGSAWPTQYVVPARNLRRFPKRLARERIVVSVWDGRLTIGLWAYGGLEDAAVPDELTIVPSP